MLGVLRTPRQMGQWYQSFSRIGKQVIKGGSGCRGYDGAANALARPDREDHYEPAAGPQFSVDARYFDCRQI